MKTAYKVILTVAGAFVGHAEHWTRCRHATRDEAQAIADKLQTRLVAHTNYRYEVVEVDA